MEKNVSNSVKMIAKAGYASRGFVYLIVGFFAALAAFGSGETMDSKQALGVVLDQPFGRVLLVLLAIGLICYSIWRGIQATLDTDDHGTDMKGLAVRAGLITSALVHISLSVWAFKLAFQQSSGSGQGSDWTQWLASQPGGEFFLLAISATLAVVGFAHIFKGYTHKFLKNFKQRISNTLENACTFGLITKGIAFLIMGYLFLEAVLGRGQAEKKGLESALNFVQSQAYGPLLLSAMGLGLLAFAFYSFLEAKYRKVGVRN